MTIEYRQAALEDAELLINIYNASFYDDPIEVSSQPLDELKHFLFYFRDGTFECTAKSYEFKKCE